MLLYSLLRILLMFLTASVIQIQSQNIMLFQAVDDSFFPLWMNWWAVAHAFDAFPTSWTLYLACFGGPGLSKRVLKVHQPGCSQIIGKELYLEHIYLAKWTAVTEAFRRGSDLIVIDLDAVMIRNPMLFLPLIKDEQGKSWDIIASRDHGPSKLSHSDNWGTGRLCTGFIYLRYSTAMLDLVEFVLKRCKKYGHDQIQFNKALARTGIAWNDPPDIMDNDLQRHYGHVIWQYPKNIDFMGFDPAVNTHIDWTYHATRGQHLQQQLLTQSKPHQNISIMMLHRYDVLRYCSATPKVFRKNPAITDTQLHSIMALHCFANFGPVGEQGDQKKSVKLTLMSEFGYLIISPDWESLVKSKTNSAINEKSAANKALFANIIDKKAFNRANNTWLNDKR